MEFTDETIISWGIHAGKKLANIPATYLIWLYENKKGKLDNGLERYIEDNLETLKSELKKDNYDRRYKFND